MNTTEVGNAFETKCHELILKAIQNDQLGISPKHSQVFHKKKYYSQLGKREIIVDLSIEIWPPRAERCSILYIIECKNYSTRPVPVEDVAEFHSKLNQIANQGFFVKGVMISNNSFQKGALDLGKNAGLMMIEVENENELSIKLHKTERTENDTTIESDKEIEAFLFDVFNLGKVEGLKRLDKRTIDEITEKILDSIDPTILRSAEKISISRLVEYFKSQYGMEFNFDTTLNTVSGKQIWGCFDLKNQKILIDSSIVETERFAFMLAHEIGHFVLHSNLKINQQVYDSFEDSEYDHTTDKYLLNNFKHWIEWQANYFAASLIMPGTPFLARLMAFQTSIGISKCGYIYLDSQPVNRQDFSKTLDYLSSFFETSRRSVIYRLEDLDVITYVTPSYKVAREINWSSFEINTETSPF